MSTPSSPDMRTWGTPTKADVQGIAYLVHVARGGAPRELEEQEAIELAHTALGTGYPTTTLQALQGLLLHTLPPEVYTLIHENSSGLLHRHQIWELLLEHHDKTQALGSQLQVTLVVKLCDQRGILALNEGWVSALELSMLQNLRLAYGQYRTIWTGGRFLCEVRAQEADVQEIFYTLFEQMSWQGDIQSWEKEARELLQVAQQL